MLDPSATGSLPTPAQIRLFHDISRAAWQTRRMREASRAVITGNLALAICWIGNMLVIAHSSWRTPATLFTSSGLAIGYLITLVFSVRWIDRQRKRSLVTVVTRREQAARLVKARPIRTAAVISAIFATQVLCMIAWSFAFRRMSNTAILSSLAIGPMIGILFFVGRFVAFRFWEDLLFAACVALAYAPFFLLEYRNLIPLSFLSLGLVIVGAGSLHYRWVTWTRSLVGSESEESPIEERP